MFRFFKRKSVNPTETSRYQGGWFSIIRESFSGAWQRNMETVSNKDLLADSTLYACVSRIATDIGSMPVGLYIRDRNTRIWERAYLESVGIINSTPNNYQTWSQFIECWILSKLLNGNAYILKQRDQDYNVVGLHVLDPWRVQLLVTPDGVIVYNLLTSEQFRLMPGGQLKVPSTEIVHDREITPFHPLQGVSPLYAAYMSATKSRDINNNASNFFKNGAQPSGILTGDVDMDDEKQAALKRYWQENFSGDHAGRVALIGADLKYTQLRFNNVDSQMIEQLRYSSEQICQAFGMPPYIVGIGSLPSGMKVDEVFDMYYKLALQGRIERLEYGLDQALEVSFPYSLELDTEILLRMDKGKRVQVVSEMVKGSIKTVNEARLEFNLQPVSGGDTVYMQQQNYSLNALAKRDAKENPFDTSAQTQVSISNSEPSAPSEPEPEEAMTGQQITSLMGIIDQVRQGTLAPEAAILIIINAFPSIDESDARKMVDSAKKIEVDEEEEEIETKQFMQELTEKLAS